MTIPGSANPLLLNAPAGGGGGGEYTIERSVRFNSSDSAYLSRTPASAGNRKTWTWAGWVKKTNNGSVYDHLFSAYLAGNDNDILEFRFQGDTLVLAAWTYVLKQTVQVFRDVSAWGHIVLAVDTTQTNPSNRVRFYWNGAQITSFTQDNAPTQNANLGVNTAAIHQIGRDYGNFVTFDGYLADVHFIDGQALDPTSFGEYDDNNVWQPIEYTGSFGINGFHLPFDDNSTAAALGTDTSGNGNTWTVNNISVTAGAGNDSLVDVPTNGTETDTGVGGQVRGNYCTLSPIAKGNYSNATLSNGNLDVSFTSTEMVFSTIAVSSGKWYYEEKITATPSSGQSTLVRAFENFTTGNTSFSWRANGGTQGLTGSPSLSSYTNGDVLGIAVDVDSTQVTFYKNGTEQGTGAYTYSTFGSNFLIFGAYSAGTASISFNFGQRPFAYTAPSGFKALCTANLPTPTIEKGSDYFDTTLYTGNGSTQTISGLDFSPDLVWVKSRNNVGGVWWHVLTDAVRGGGYYLHSNTTNAESGGGTSLVTGFTSDGFTLNNSPNGTVNYSGDTYVAWTWDAGDSTVTNTDGSITSQVRANTSAGFSIVTYTGSGTAGSTIGHGLGVAPAFIITKRTSSTNPWYCYHSSLGSSYFISLDSTSAASNSSGYWGTINSTVFGQGSATAGPNNGSQVAYCFAPVDGYSSFGSYTGNNSTSGPFIYTGFRPRWILFKRSDSTSDWFIFDTARGLHNLTTNYLRPNDSGVENSDASLDILSNGFKSRSTAASINASGGRHIYAAFAENPFSLARAR